MAPSAPHAASSVLPNILPDRVLLEDLDERQRDAVTSSAAPLAVLAGAGAGKTRVLTRRIAWQAHQGRIDPAHTLAVTFTRKAAGELSRRLEALGVARGVTSGTLHALALAQLRNRAAVGGRSMPALLERKARILGPLLGRGAAATVATREIAGEIEWAKARHITPDDYTPAVSESGRTPPRPAAEVATLYHRYEVEKRRRRVIDFDDLLWGLGDALERDAAFAAAQRTRFRHLFVDEFQDVSPAQLRVIRGWLGDRSDLCVVGDPDQAIFSFAGAEPGYLRDFLRHFRGASVVRLDHNYRSSPAIVAVADAVLADDGRPRTAHRAVRTDGPPPTVTAHDDEDAEAATAVEALRAARATTGSWSSGAVLYRTNAQSAAFERALGEAAVPFRVQGDGRFLERPEVRAALEELRRAATATPGRSFATHLDDLEAEPHPGNEEQAEHAAALVRLGREYLAVEAGVGSVDGFVTYLSTALRGEPVDVGQDAVSLLTFHRAKGLEFHTVCVTGLERGLVPISHAETPPTRAEERRLLYVAITRAEHVLHLSYARRRELGSRAMGRSPSPWLAPIEQLLSQNGAAAPSSSPRGPDAARARLTATRSNGRATTRERPSRIDATDDELLAALVTWRRNLARASTVPAYVIFPDRTLRAVAEAKPTSQDELLALPGIGPVKAERHGATVLDLVRRHAS